MKAATLFAMIIASAMAIHLPDAEKINTWMTPDGFVGTIVSVILALVFLMGACCMLNVQTPIAYPTKSIDWGKVEEHE